MDSGKSDMAIWGVVVKGGGVECKYEIEQTAEEAQYVHITNVALPPNADKGSCSLMIEFNGQEFCIATLDKERHPQHNLDFVLDQTVVFKVIGKSDIHVLGYQTVIEVPPSMGPGYGSDDDEDEDEDEDFSADDEDDEDEDSDEPPLLVANGKAPIQAAGNKRIIPVQRVQHDDEDEDGESDEDEDEDEDGIAGLQLGSDDIVMELDEGEDEDEDEDEDDFGDIEAGGFGPSPDEDENEDEGEDEDEDEDEDDTPVKVQPGAKRPGLQTLTPQPDKKSKGMNGAAQPKAPQTAPPKQSQSKVQPVKQQQQGKKEQQADKAAKKDQGKPAAPAILKPKTEAEYETAVAQLLKGQPGKILNISKIGSSIQKPDGVSKVSQWLKSRSKVFKVDGENVKLIA